MDDKLRKQLEKDIKQTAKGLGIPPGSAEIFANEALKSLANTLKSKPVVTPSDLDRLLAKALKKYHSDLAYVYQIRDKII